MTATIAELKRPLRNLIDNRLDGIDRILIEAGASRAERGNILSDIEGQIYEMLRAGVGEEEPTRRDVLDVLAKLDPPEAYAPEEQRDKAAELKPAPVISPKPPLQNAPEKSRTPTLGILACVGGLMTLLIGLPGSMLVAFLLADSSELVVVFLILESFFLFFVGLPSCVLGVISALAIRKSNGKLDNITCAAIGITAFPLCLFNAAMVMTAVAESLIGVIFLCIFYVTLGCVGAIHLVYRILDMTCLGKNGTSKGV
jgi:hypothetical protein